MSDLPLTGARAVLEGIDEFVGDVARMEGALEGNNTALGSAATATAGATKATDEFQEKLGGVNSLLRGDLSGAITAFSGAAMLGGMAVTIGLVAKAFDGMMDSAASWGGTIDILSYQTGESTEDISRFVGALNAVGIETSALTPAFRTFNNGMLTMKQAAEQGVPPTGAFAEALERMGISAFDSEGNLRGFVEMFPEIADGLNRLPGGAERSAVAMDIFGRSAHGMGEILEKSGDEIKDLMARTDELNMTMSGPAAQAAEDYEQSIAKRDQALQSLAVTIGTKMIPAHTELYNSIDEAMRGETSWVEVIGNLVVPGLAKARYEMEHAAQAARDLQAAERGIGRGLGETAARAAQGLNLEGGAATKAAGGTLAWSAATQKAIDAANGLTTASLQLSYALPSALSGVDVSGFAGGGQATLDFAGQIYDAYTNIGNAGVSAWDQIAKKQAESMQQQRDAAMLAAQDVEWWAQDQNEFILDNAAKLTPELAAEFTLRTEAARVESDKVKENNADLALALLDQESQYQQDKLAIMTDPNLTEEERGAKLAILDRENGEAIERMRARAETEAQIAQARWDREVAMMQTAGTAGGKSFADEVNKGIDMTLLKMQSLGIIGGEQAGIARDSLVSAFADATSGADGTIKSTAGITTSLVDLTGKVWALTITQDGIAARIVGDLGTDLAILQQTQWMIDVKVNLDAPEGMHHDRSTVMEHDLMELQQWADTHTIDVRMNAPGAENISGMAAHPQRLYQSLTPPATPQTVVVERDARSYTANFTPAGPLPSAGSVQDSFLAMRLGGW